MCFVEVNCILQQRRCNGLTASGQNNLDQICKGLGESWGIEVPRVAENGGVAAIRQLCDQPCVHSKSRSVRWV